MTLSRAAKYGGRGVIVAGGVILLFVIYQLWGTSLQYSRAQSDLRGDFEVLLVQAQELDSTQLPQNGGLDGLGEAENQDFRPTSDQTFAGSDGLADGSVEADQASDPNNQPNQPNSDQLSQLNDPNNQSPQEITVTPTTRLSVETLENSEIKVADGAEEILPLLYTDRGEAMAQIQIPSIGLDEIVVEGTGVDDLRKGPGHYAWTPLPGQPGNVSIAGHRTTYGAPFADIGKLRPGDKIFVQTVQGEFEYEVLAQSDPTRGNIIVTPDRADLLTDQGDNRLTLTSCHPRFSSRQRIVVQARLIGNPVVPIGNLLNPSSSGQIEVPILFASEEFPGANLEAGEQASQEFPGEDIAAIDARDGSPDNPGAAGSIDGADVGQEGESANIATNSQPASPQNGADSATSTDAAAAEASADATAAPEASATANATPEASATATEASATSPAAPGNPIVVEEDGFGSGLNGDRSAIPSAVLWGVATLLVWVAVWLVGSRWRMWPSVAVGLIPVLLCLFVAFNYVDRAIPSY